MSCLCDLFLIFSLIFIVINPIPSFKQMYLIFVPYLDNVFYYSWMITWMKKANNFQLAKVHL